MTTHIIGKPPAPKGGATPRDPEPDPAVTTYGELEPGGIVESDGDLGIRTWEDGTSAAFLVDLESGEPWQPRNPVRRVSASVVVHEEPGTHVWPDDADSSRVAILEPESGRMSYDRAEAETIIRQLTAWLAQEPASPESGEPEPAELQAGDRIGVVFEGCSDDVHGLRVGIVKRQPAEDRSELATNYEKEPDSPESGEPELENVDPLIADGLHGRPLGDSELRRCFTEPESAEDRSKPAPGWSVPFLIHGYGDSFGGGGDWCILAPDGEAAVAFGSKGDAIAYSYAQQAGKGGESDG